ncbi:uncharacterized protein Bfra_002833 [Botrytis fragariae]|uniref:BTB domain-containing protein n=1 Tax=Botrytis fragariae TaxID=1964551 RepID=A0A8H6AZ77_9HELO|nr:uncharacterized protein Bfra_002833 [Botrytis fragariae]KAF5876429.1 hypothetical protein Bfra_002833 [Botrytis fragariae]
MTPSKKDQRGLAPNNQSSGTAIAKGEERESAVGAHRGEFEERGDVKDETQTPQGDHMCEKGSYFKDYEEYEETDEDIEEVPTPAKRITGVSHRMPCVIAEKEVKKPYRESASSTTTRTRKEPILTKFVTFIYKNQSVTIGSEHWRSRLEQWRDDLQDEGLIGVVWDERAEPWKYQKRSKESKKMGAYICDFETPSEKAGLVLHCPVEHKEDEQRNNFTPLHCPTEDQEDGSPEKEIVKIYIGPERAVIRVYKKVLCEKIPYFKKFFNGTSQEAASNSVTFHSGDFEAFHDLMWWVSNGHLPPWSIYPDGKEMDERMQDDCPVVRIQTEFNWGGLYLLAKRLCVENLMNLITDYVVRALELNRAILTKEDIAGIYKHTPKNCGLRRLACYSFNYDLDRCPPEFWPRYYDMAKRIDGLEDDSVALRRGPHGEVVTFTGIWDFPPCKFHDHLDGEICDQKKLKDREVGIRRPEKIH